MKKHSKYDKLTKAELIERLEQLESRFVGLLEDAEKHAESEPEYKSELKLGFISSAIERTEKEFLQVI